ncbi:MAG TPA: hypothetical protein VIV63_11270 [Steroidobacteraceae bacterium]
MKWTALVAASAISLASAVAGAAPAKSATIEKSPDVLRAPQVRKSAARASTPLLLAPPITAAAAPTVEDVGDADSFGRNVTYLGLAQTLSVTVQPDCTGSDPTLERCVVANPAPAPTSFNEAGLATINLPARATKSLVCFALTPFIQIQWENNLATPATARFNANALITIDNEVLDDPTLIDPGTGLPFGGVLSLGLGTFTDFHTLQPAETDFKALQMSRSCIAGIISKQNLIEGYGLTETQATQFFKKPMAITFGARGTVGLSAFANYFYGIRLYGD